ncbi:MAG: hypothetical protein JW797_02685, partial [Bradymonadales bacterium]|nr:hypothetical protein [Bradymonadales bacterium]
PPSAASPPLPPHRHGAGADAPSACYAGTSPGLRLGGGGSQVGLGCGILSPMERIRASAICMLVFLCGCIQNAEPVVTPGTPLDLGLDAFLGDDTAEEPVDAADIAEDGEQEEEVEVVLAEGEPCSLLEQDCKAGLRCTIGQGGTGICVLIGPRVEGERCGETVDNCAANLVCMDEGDPDDPGFRCLRLCDGQSGEGCDPWQRCEGPLGWTIEPVGVCLDQ